MGETNGWVEAVNVRFVDRCRVGDGKIFSVREGRATTTAVMIRARPVGVGVRKAKFSEVGEKELRRSI